MMPAMARRRVAALAMLTRCVTALLLPRAPVRVHTVGLRAAPQKYDDTTAPLAATLRSSEFAATAATLSKALAPSIGLAIVGTVAFGPLAVWLRTFINGEGLAVLANDEGQYFQNYVNAIDVMFDLGVPWCCGAFTPSTRIVSRRGCRGWFLF